MVGWHNHEIGYMWTKIKSGGREHSHDRGRSGEGEGKTAMKSMERYWSLPACLPIQIDQQLHPMREGEPGHPTYTMLQQSSPPTLRLGRAQLLSCCHQHLLCHRHLPCSFSYGLCGKDVQRKGNYDTLDTLWGHDSIPAHCNRAKYMSFIFLTLFQAI